MKNVILLLFICTGISSCSSTYFLSILSTDSKNVTIIENGDFLIEDDSLWVAYCFNGAGAPVQITAFNKSSRPLTIDWKKSALIIDNNAFGYSDNIVGIEGISGGRTISYNHNENLSSGAYQGGFMGEVTLPNDVTYILPGTSVSKIPLSIETMDYSLIPDSLYTSGSIPNKKGQNVAIKRIDYTIGNTPLRFRSYLTVYDEDKNIKVFDQEFYQSTLIKSKKITPMNLSDRLGEKGYLFYNQKDEYNTPLIVVGTVAGLCGVVWALSAATDIDMSEHDF